MGNPGTLILEHDDQISRATEGAGLNAEADAPAPCVLKHVARDLGHGCREPGLFARIVPENLAQLPGPLTAKNDIVLESYFHLE